MTEQAGRTVHPLGADGAIRDWLVSPAEPDFGFRNGVTWTARDGRRLALIGNASFTVDGTDPDIGQDGRPDTGVHLDNPACTMRFGADFLEASYGGHRLVLDIANARRADLGTTG